MQLTNLLQLEGAIELLTGLHIGSGDAEMHIGGTDNPVIKHPHTNEPYIPGSSLKGKMRSLLEWRSGQVQEKPLGYGDYKSSQNPEVKAILQLFGVSGGDDLSLRQAEEIGPTRLSFWDCALEKVWVDDIRSRNLLLTEAKQENSINRISGTSDNLRNTERVPAGARFVFKLTFKQFDGDGDELLDSVLAGLKLLEFDGIGGSGSRGYGKIRFHLADSALAARFEQIKRFN
jgi:CRISPR-associated protein Csm3